MSGNSFSSLDARSAKPSLLIRLLRGVMRRLPIYSGLTRLSFNWISNRLFSRCPRELVATLRNGTKMLVDANDFDGRILYLFGSIDPKVHSVTQSLLRPGDRFLDIGANYSSIGIFAASAVGTDGHVHLFEPQPDLCCRVNDAIGRGQFGNVTLHRVGLMDRDEEMLLSRPKHHSGMASFVLSDRHDEWVSQSLPVKNIATYVPPLIADYPFGVKLDVEGAEPKLMRWLVRQHNLRFIVFESVQNQLELWDIVQSGNLQLYGLCRTLFSMQLQLISGFDQMSDFHDLLAVRINNRKKLPQFAHPRQLLQWMESPTTVACVAPADGSRTCAT
jgi:FkbM family methyltransferase